MFEDHGKDYKTVKERMKDLIIKTLISVEFPLNKALQGGTKHKGVCYELYGFDIIIDSDLKPWILEVNISPSFSSSSPFDKTLKTKLICDALTIIGVKPVNHEKYVKEEAQRLSQNLEDDNKTPNKLISDISSENLDDDDIALLLDFEEEQRRWQNFELIFPLSKTYKKYAKFFPEKRYNNHLLWSHVKEPLIDVADLEL